MIRNLILLGILMLSTLLYSQNKLTGIVVDEHSGEKLLGVNIILLGSSNGTATDTVGEFALLNIPNGKQKIAFSYVGYEDFIIELDFPYSNDILKVKLEQHAEEFEEIFVNATRSSRTIDNEPTRVEVIAGEEIDEKISMDPSNISIILSESTGIQVQQTSASSANSTFRIQGLDGRYTQLLKDGYPLYGGFSGSLSLVQIPPLDLQQVEIIKGSSSTLYGGGAIAGLINLSTKKPKELREISFLVNATSAMGLDLSGYYSEKYKKHGVTILASRNTQKVYDNNDDNFSDIPQIERYTVNPKLLFYFDERKTLEIAGSFTTEERLGGNIEAVENNNNPNNYYFEKNQSNRYSLQIGYNYRGEEDYFSIKNSIGFFDRKLTLPDYLFSGTQFSTFSEAVYNLSANTGDWLFGVNLLTERFKDRSPVDIKKSFDDLTFGSFIQNNFDLSENYSLETGFRLDYNQDYGVFALPRINLLMKITPDLSSRIGGGLGYKIPTIFMEKSDELAFRNILPIDMDIVKAEKSYGFNFDVNYSTILFNKIVFSINNLFFYTRITDPLILEYNQTNNFYEFMTFNGFNDTKGIETNIKFSLGHYKLFAGYTFTDVKTHSNDLSASFPLTPKHKLGIVLIYEVHGDMRVGLEAYYTGNQTLSSGTNVTDFWVNGLMIEKRFNKFSLYINFENIFDTRQSNYGAMFTGTNENPNFVEIYAPTDGRIINGGIKLSL
ncbi:MAG: TonB-dependent receptor [Ignavibacteriales bacterium]|nr:TonB-dependent receptor [Ignavibacteriota bacterium]MCB9249894.1 TonB-dependent receptor [Ignavibacteriales bacterium]